MMPQRCVSSWSTSRAQRVFYVAVTITALVTAAYLAICSHYSKSLSRPSAEFPLFRTRISSVSRLADCPRVIPHMLEGSWVPRANISAQEVQKMDDYLVRTRGDYRIPASLQRADQLCGSVAYEGMFFHKFLSFRAVCNPKGPTPCCRNFICSNSSAEDCRCTTCYDSRVPVHAELSEWLPPRPECRPLLFNSSAACTLLQGTRLLVVGDSFLRHVFVTLTLLLSGDFHRGALKKNADPKVLAKCTGMYQINGPACRDLLEENRTFCQGSVWTDYQEVFKAVDSPAFFSHLQTATSRKERLLILAGIGIHDNFFPWVVWSGFLRPLVDFLTKRSTFNNPQPPGWPKLIWAAAHAPGLLKSPSFFFQSSEGVRAFNEMMSTFLQSYSIPVFDTFNLTAPLHSVDGTHYGYGANMAKVQILLNWILEQKKREKW